MICIYQHYMLMYTVLVKVPKSGSCKKMRWGIGEKRCLYTVTWQLAQQLRKVAAFLVNTYDKDPGCCHYPSCMGDCCRLFTSAPPMNVSATATFVRCGC